MPRQFGKIDASARWPACPECRRKHERGGPCAPGGVWLSNGTAARSSAAVWLVRPMPDGQWPPNQRVPRDDSFSWLVRSHCGHPGGAKLWAFYRKADADQYESIFMADPCHYTRCPAPRSKTTGGDDL